ncbi:MAG: MOSC domain-containing protein [Bdellovibrionales bacterium]|nr:MOSC domain-containing protein [Bdellovibrionales bacterium]
MRVLSIQVGQSRDITARGKVWPTGIFKTPVPGPVYLDVNGLTGDRQVHESVHGGDGRALYAISNQAYQFWGSLVPSGVELNPGAFGENVTLDELDEPSIEVGDEFELGETLIQAMMPRFPCLLFASRMGMEADAQKIMRLSDHPGILFRVLRPGFIDRGQSMVPVKRSGTGVTMTDFLKMTSDDQMSHADFNRVKDLGLLPQKTIERLAYRLV